MILIEFPDILVMEIKENQSEVITLHRAKPPMHFTNCKAYFIDFEVISQDFLSFAKQIFLIFKLIYFKD